MASGEKRARETGEGSRDRNIKVLFLASEAVPFAKTGGLADVVGSLPGALRRLGVDARLCLPLYREIKEGGHRLTPLLSRLEVPFGTGRMACSVLTGETVHGVPVYFFEREDLFDRPNLYQTPASDYYDNFERFAFFSRAALHFSMRASLHMDVIHCNDWQTGLAPAYLKTLYRAEQSFLGTASVFTIHNIGYQGLFPSEKLGLSGIPTSEFHPEGLEYWGQISLLKAGIVYADAITTVSPRYSEEIRTPEFGFGLDGILKKRSNALYGILNGVNYDEWDPGRDPYLPFHYDSENMTGKKENKVSLISETGLDQELVQKPLVGFISRLSDQKGCDLVMQVAPRLVKEGAGLLVLGTGEESYEKAMLQLAENNRGRIHVRIGFDEPMAHRIMAGCDILLVPSRYEPCGLTQMYALRYATVPVVRATGGLADTITQFSSNTREGNGFRFDPYESEALFSAIRRALTFYQKKASWKQLTANGMKAGFSWDRSARSYLEIYRALLSWNH